MVTNKKAIVGVYVMLLFSIIFTWQCRENINEQDNFSTVNLTKAEIRMMAERKEGILLFKAHATSTLGISDVPDSDSEKSDAESMLKTFNENFAKIISFPSDSNCKLNKREIIITEEGNQPVIRATYGINCDKRLHATDMTVDLAKFYPNIKTLSVVQPLINTELKFEAGSNSRPGKVKIE